jgi:hypothetical protein
MDKCDKFMESLGGTWYDEIFFPGRKEFGANTEPYLTELFYVFKKLGMKQANKIANQKLKDRIRVPSYVNYIAGRNIHIQHQNYFVYLDFKKVNPAMEPERQGKE